MAARFASVLGTRAQALARCRGRWLAGGVGHFVLEALQVLFECMIAFGDPLLVGVVHRDFLLKDKHEVWLPRAFETLGDRVTRGMNTGVAEAASVAGSRSPLRIARTMRCPVHPLRSLMTFANWIFIWVSTFCMRWMHVLTACTWSPRWRQYVRTMRIAADGWNELRSSP